MLPKKKYKSITSDFLARELADKDINAKVDDSTVTVHSDNLDKAKEIVKHLGYKHSVVGGLNESVEQVDERKLSQAELDYREDYVKSMKPALKKFKDRYGEDGESVMYGIATKLAKQKSKKLAKVNETAANKESAHVAADSEATHPITKSTKEEKKAKKPSVLINLATIKAITKQGSQ